LTEDVSTEVRVPESPPGVVFARQMGISHAEFFRILPPVVDALPHHIGVDSVRIENGTRRLTLSLGPEVERRLGAMRLPGFELRVEFRGYRQSEVEAFMARFDTVFHRGGG
jgi:hypothetical protein